MKLRGIDISKYNGTPNTTGLDFGVVKATYGPFPDSKYKSHEATFRKAGIPTGAYHFGIRWLPVNLQVMAFLRTAKNADFLALDIEKDGRRDRMTDTQARSFIRQVQDKGLRIGLYMSDSVFRDLGQNWDWVAHYDLPRAATGVGGPYHPWDMWQWQGHPIDRNWLRGSLLAFLAKAGNKNLVPPPKPAPVSPRTLTTLRRLIANLTAITHPSQAQRDKLALYKKRLIEYLNRGK